MRNEDALAGGDGAADSQPSLDLPDGVPARFEPRSTLELLDGLKLYRVWDSVRGELLALRLVARDGGRNRSGIVGEIKPVAVPDVPRLRFAREIHDFGAHIGIATPLVEGRTLKEEVNQNGPLEQEQVLALTRSLCETLARLHSAGYVHLDVGPSHIVRDSSGRGVLLDLGTAVALATAEREGARDWCEVSACTPPEQARRMPVDARADIYSLAVTMFWCLSGTWPVQQGHDFATRLQNGERASLTESASGVDPRFAAVVERCLAVDPNDRYTNLEGLAQDLPTEGSLRSHTPEAPSVSRSRLLGGAAIAAAAIAIAGVKLGGVSAAAAEVDRITIRRVPATGQYEELSSGQRVQRGEYFEFVVACPSPTYFYLVSEDSLGRQSVLFPTRRDGMSNPLIGSEVVLPGKVGKQQMQWMFRGTGQDKERLLAIAVDYPLPGIESDLKRAAGDDSFRPCREIMRDVGLVPARLPADAESKPVERFDFERLHDACLGLSGAVVEQWLFPTDG